jgi:hypothetical protein
MKQEYENALDYHVKKLQEIPDLFDQISASSKSKDGRNVSESGEAIILDHIKKFEVPEQIVMKYPLPRWWYDYGMSDLAVNIKVTVAGGNDNLMGKDGFYYSLTGRSPEDLPNDYWPTHFEALHYGRLNRPASFADTDYTFLVINRETKNIHWTTLRSLVKINTNGSQACPLQVTNWSENEERKTRSIEDADAFLMSAYRLGIEKSGIKLFEFNKFNW